MSKTKIDDLLFKPLVFSDQDGERLVIIYAYDNEVSKCLSARGKPVISNVIKIHMFDITTSIVMDEAIMSIATIGDINKFREAVQEADPKAYAEELHVASNMLIGEMGDCSIRLQAMAKAFTTLRYIGGMSDKRTNADARDENSNTSQINFKSITGNDTKLNKEDVERVSELVYDIIMHNLSIDTKNEEHIRRLRAEVEYKLIEALPSVLKADSLQVDMEPILQQIRMFQGIDQENSEN